MSTNRSSTAWSARGDGSSVEVADGITSDQIPAVGRKGGREDVCGTLNVSLAGRPFCLECRVSWVQVPPEAAHFFGKNDCLGCAVLLCFVVCLTLLASFFLLHLSVNMYYTCIYM